MRRMGFSKSWPKMKQPEFTTFRFKRKDRDWSVEEQVSMWLHNRTKNALCMGIGEIVKKEPRSVLYPEELTPFHPFVTESEAIADGFKDLAEFLKFMKKTYGEDRLHKEPMNKLTIRRL